MGQKQRIGAEQEEAEAYRAVETKGKVRSKQRKQGEGELGRNRGRTEVHTELKQFPSRGDVCAGKESAVPKRSEKDRR